MPRSKATVPPVPLPESPILVNVQRVDIYADIENVPLSDDRIGRASVNLKFPSMDVMAVTLTVGTGAPGTGGFGGFVDIAKLRIPQDLLPVLLRVLTVAVKESEKRNVRALVDAEPSRISA